MQLYPTPCEMMKLSLCKKDIEFAFLRCSESSLELPLKVAVLKGRRIVPPSLISSKLLSVRSIWYLTALLRHYATLYCYYKEEEEKELVLYLAFILCFSLI